MSLNDFQRLPLLSSVSLYHVFFAVPIWQWRIQNVVGFGLGGLVSQLPQQNRLEYSLASLALSGAWSTLCAHAEHSRQDPECLCSSAVFRYCGPTALHPDGSGEVLPCARDASGSPPGPEQGGH